MIISWYYFFSDVKNNCEFEKKNFPQVKILIDPVVSEKKKCLDINVAVKNERPQIIVR